jgi:hypothetical protein
MSLVGEEGEPERRAKRAERVALCRNLMISLGMLSGPGAFECITSYHAGEGEGGSPRGSMMYGSGLSGCSHGGMGSSGGVARVCSMSKCE